MSQTKIKQECRAILQVMASLHHSSSIDEISQCLEIPMPRRTLQRRLAYLVETTELTAYGEKRGRRYSLTMKLSTAKPVTEDETYIPISIEAQEVKDYES